MGSTLVSVVIPTYDRPDLLRRAVDSVTNQTYKNIELIVVDDASPNSNAEDEVYRAFPNLDDRFHRVVFYRQVTNRGVCEARNKGLELSEGDYVAFLDDDDAWKPEKLERQLTVAKANDVSLVYCWVRRTGPEGDTRAINKKDAEGKVIQDLLEGNITGTTSTILVDREVAIRVGGFDPEFLRWNDWDFVLRVAQEHKFGVVRDHLVVQYNSERHQLSGDHDKLVISAERLLEKHRDVAEEIDALSNFYAWVRWGVGYSAMMNGRYDEARRNLLKAINHNPFQWEFYLYLMVVSGGRYTLRPAQYLKRSITRLLSKL